MTDCLKVTDLSVSIGKVAPVDGVSFTIHRGETFALLGESGCGKSMTALALMRLLPPAAVIRAGEVVHAGQSLLQLTEAEMRKVRGGRIGMIFQEPGTSLNPVMTLGQQMAEVLSQHKQLQGEAIRDAATALFEQVGLPEPARRFDEYPFQLSGGMKQRAMIAMALAGEPELLIADEPTTALDVTLQAQVLDLLAKLQAERQMGMLLITHDLAVVERMADHIGVMYAGELVEVGPREAFFANPAHPYAQKLFAALPERTGRHQPLQTLPGRVPALDELGPGCRFAPRCSQAHARCRTEAPVWHVLRAGQRVRCHLYDMTAQGQQTQIIAPTMTQLVAPEASTDTAVLMRVEDLSVHFPIRKGLLQRVVGHVKAVDGVSLTLHAGRTLALVGESGCGKTTAGKAILDLIPRTGGKVMLQSLQTSAEQSVRHMAQMVFQDPFASLNPRMRVAEIISEGMSAMGIQGDQRARIAELLQQVGLAPQMANRYPHEFSGGQRQRIAIARALAVNPALLICDEPTSALDVSVQAQIVNLLRELQQRLGLAYLFITHNIALVDYLADEVAVMYLGRVVEQGPAAAVLENPQHPYTRLLLNAALSRQRVDNSRGAGGGRAIASTPSVKGELPSAVNPPSGCHFHPRCPQANARCRSEYPPSIEIGGQRRVACWLVSDE